MVTTNIADPQIIEEIVRRIVNVRPPEKVILFGGRARGEARPNSDIDTRWNCAMTPSFGLRR